MNYVEVLKELKDSLRRLVEILRLDRRCQWTSKFENDLLWCDELLNKTPSKEEVYNLSSSIRSVFQGMGSFNDYGPAKYNPATRKCEPIPGTEDFEKVVEKVFSLAVDLRVIKK